MFDVLVLHSEPVQQHVIRCASYETAQEAYHRLYESDLDLVDARILPQNFEHHVPAAFITHLVDTRSGLCLLDNSKRRAV